MRITSDRVNTEFKKSGRASGHFLKFTSATVSAPDAQITNLNYLIMSNAGRYAEVEKLYQIPPCCSPKFPGSTKSVSSTSAAIAVLASATATIQYWVDDDRFCEWNVPFRGGTSVPQPARLVFGK